MPAFRLLDLTLPSPEENLALDDALLDELEERGGERAAEEAGPAGNDNFHGSGI